MNKRELISSPEYCATVEEVDVSTTSWKGRKIVHIGSTLACEEVKQFEMYDKMSKIDSCRSLMAI